MGPWTLLGILAAAVILQVTLARYAVGGAWTFDLVLVAVVYVALYGGATTGLVAGTVGGLVQDALATGIVGVGALAKTLVGFAAGVVGSQFVLTRGLARVLLVAAASVAHRVLVLALSGLIELSWPGVSWGAMLGETVLNAAAGFVAFQATELLPGALDRHRARRQARWRRRRW